MTEEVLKLDNQICFPFYAMSRVIIRGYQPYLDKLGLTYTQYLVMLVLWEQDGLSVNEIAERLILNTNTVTPMLKRMEGMGLLERIKGEADERKVFINITEKGQAMHEEASRIPSQLLQALNQEGKDLTDLLEMRDKINELLHRGY
ncbi:MarR family winged helix-turn-helix transcriptional regulator [Mongoliitalea daihaiensis]|uniref:MarR family winged helix-turn-helix transcriptional regulator n=1 Tax=Mongoliitalea daihaiensis TaxID=2782006 RepID=UPI001F2C01A3|nr:MarR family transcriptional regulator [Mongoliitalea daihaiensis]UJP63358.1 MarR family transcriptional regulator [Mongoliitalea daihaiensis]